MKGIRCRACTLWHLPSILSFEIPFSALTYLSALAPRYLFSIGLYFGMPNKSWNESEQTSAFTGIKAFLGKGCSFLLYCIIILYPRYGADSHESRLQVPVDRVEPVATRLVPMDHLKSRQLDIFCALSDHYRYGWFCRN